MLAATKIEGAPEVSSEGSRPWGFAKKVFGSSQSNTQTKNTPANLGENAEVDNGNKEKKTKKPFQLNLTWGKKTSKQQQSSNVSNESHESPVSSPDQPMSPSPTSPLTKSATFYSSPHASMLRRPTVSSLDTPALSSTLRSPHPTRSSQPTIVTRRPRAQSECALHARRPTLATSDVHPPRSPQPYPHTPSMRPGSAGFFARSMPASPKTVGSLENIALTAPIPNPSSVRSNTISAQSRSNLSGDDVCPMSPPLTKRSPLAPKRQISHRRVQSESSATINRTVQHVLPANNRSDATPPGTDGSRTEQTPINETPFSRLTAQTTPITRHSVCDLRSTMSEKPARAFNSPLAPRRGSILKQELITQSSEFTPPSTKGSMQNVLQSVQTSTCSDDEIHDPFITEDVMRLNTLAQGLVYLTISDLQGVKEALTKAIEANTDDLLNLEKEHDAILRKKQEQELWLQLANQTSFLGGDEGVVKGAVNGSDVAVDVELRGR